jgi:hypothetical protein
LQLNIELREEGFALVDELLSGDGGASGEGQFVQSLDVIQGVLDALQMRAPASRRGAQSERSIPEHVLQQVVVLDDLPIASGLMVPQLAADVSGVVHLFDFL